jgi:hypothetical protein
MTIRNGLSSTVSQALTAIALLGRKTSITRDQDPFRPDRSPPFCRLLCGLSPVTYHSRQLAILRLLRNPIHFHRLRQLRLQRAELPGEERPMIGPTTRATAENFHSVH